MASQSISDAGTRAHVVPGGPSFVYDLSRLTIRKASVGSMNNNAYLLTDKQSGQQLLIDAAADPARLKALVSEGTGRLDQILTTHQHHDHVGALRAMTDAGVETSAGDADADALPVTPTRRLHHGDQVGLGASHFDVIELRGHTPGGVALVYTDPETDVVHIFTGDSLFPGGVGNTKNPGQDFDQLFADVTQRIFDAYPHAHIHPGHAHIHPGHGDSTTLDAERPHLAEWKSRGW